MIVIVKSYETLTIHEFVLSSFHTQLDQLCTKVQEEKRSMCKFTLLYCLFFLFFAHRCEWCGITAHPACHKSIPPECNFGVLEPIYLPPHCVSIPRTEISMETILGVAKKSRETAANIRKKIIPTLRPVLIDSKKLECLLKLS